MSQYSISKITPSAPGSLGSISVIGNATAIANGKSYFNASTGDFLPSYDTPPAGYSLVQATTFEITGNKKYNGRYTVYTQKNSSDTRSSIFDNGQTQINVAEAIPELTPSDDPTLATSGVLINFSTYTIAIGTTTVIVPPTSIIKKFTVPLIGKNIKPWGEAYNQSLIDLLDNTASVTSPSNPLTGQLWYDTGLGKLRLWQGGNWYTYGNAVTAKVIQTSAAKEWVIKHNLVIPAPFICNVTAFVVRNGEYRTIIPAGVSFVDENTIRVTFTKAESGAVIIHA